MCPTLQTHIHTYQFPLLEDWYCYICLKVLQLTKPSVDDIWIASSNSEDSSLQCTCISNWQLN